ncbi:MAG: AraC family transcriptional regulator [Edaphobacter sp.]|uniref:AraC family transcriptional regulator n=1 Tax=Edaphobacter sp. TaxID=1934404 RepID=UPI00238B9900|nr:AraC family transcriptional regulator [Edaphobacter sp.]MDE1178064.1 AraC family transcriptional regulator [Edaphobacter sp.]
MTIKDDVKALRAELAERIAAHARTKGDHQTSVPGLLLTRLVDETPCYRAAVQPSLTLFAQGGKRIQLGGVDYLCDNSSFFLSSIYVPIESQVTQASPAKPLLTMKLFLDMAGVREMLNREDFIVPKQSSSRERGVAVGESTAGLLSACIRLIDLLSSPEDIPYLHPLIQREIVYRVLRTPQAQSLRAVVTSGDLSNRTAHVMSWLRTNYAKPLRMEELAEIARMGVSTLHHQFRALTSMSPLQYQKQLRLESARERMVMNGIDANTAAFEVGYESVSQFSREYSRHFGLPPIRDVKAMRDRQDAEAIRH